MRIDRIEVTNFKGFEKGIFSFDKDFTLFVGENGSGKTSILSSVAVALGIFEGNETIKKTIRPNERAWRRIYDDEIRLIPSKAGDRGLFEPCDFCEVAANGRVEEHQPPISWKRRVVEGRRKNDADEVLAEIDSTIGRAASQITPAPAIAYYGAGRTWMPSNERVQRAESQIKKPRQWDGYYDCLQERIRLKDLDQWFRDEAAARDDKGGWRPGYQTVRCAILNCIPKALDIHWDPTRLEICLNIDGKITPFSMLSDGQKSVAAMVADLAIRSVTLNSFLFGDTEEVPDSTKLPVVLEKTPGVVLIDEIDVHLHPRWQRRIVKDLRKTFPRIQFICTSHSPQVVGEVNSKCIRIFDSKTNRWEAPNQSYGMDSNWILNVLMESDSSDPDIQSAVKSVQHLAQEKKFSSAREVLAKLRKSVGNSEEIQRAASTIERFELLGK